LRVLVTGAGGMVGREVVEALEPHEVVGLDHAALDVGDRDSVLGAIGSIQPDAIVHCAAMTAVDACESEPDRAFLVNALGVRFVMEGARRAGAYVVTLSTDYVFDGTQSEPYHEWDTPNPASVYGQSKLGGEFEIDLECAVVRTSWVIGRYGANMAKTVLRLAAGDSPLRFVDDQRGCPTIAADLATMLRTFVVERLPGTWHVTNQGAVSWFEFAGEVLRAAGDDPQRVTPISTADLDPPRPAPRPANSVLDNRALRLAGRKLLPDFRESLPELVRAIP
jgi:dTDP-4-dehydrorhamnose reductase